jgi:hypothetical protein
LIHFPISFLLHPPQLQDRRDRGHAMATRGSAWHVARGSAGAQACPVTSLKRGFGTAPY